MSYAWNQMLSKRAGLPHHISLGARFGVGRIATAGCFLKICGGGLTQVSRMEHQALCQRSDDKNSQAESRDKWDFKVSGIRQQQTRFKN